MRTSEATAWATGLLVLLLAVPALAGPGAGATGASWDDSHMQSLHRDVAPGPKRPFISGSTRYGALSDPHPERATERVPSTLKSFTQRTWKQGRLPAGASSPVWASGPERSFGDTGSLRRNSAGSSTLRQDAVSHRH